MRRCLSYLPALAPDGSPPLKRSRAPHDSRRDSLGIARLALGELRTTFHELGTRRFVKDLKSGRGVTHG